jgi:hypothetical protein
MSNVLQVKITMIRTIVEEHVVDVPIDYLSADEEGIYSFDQIKEEAESLIRIRTPHTPDTLSLEVDEVEILDSPDDFNYWS